MYFSNSEPEVQNSLSQIQFLRVSHSVATRSGGKIGSYNKMSPYLFSADLLVGGGGAAVLDPISDAWQRKVSRFPASIFLFDWHAILAARFISRTTWEVVSGLRFNQVFLVAWRCASVDVIYTHDISLLTLLNKSERSWCCIVIVIDRMRCHWFIRSYLIDNRILDFHWVLVMCSFLESYSTCFLYSLSSELVLCYKKVLSWKLVPAMILAILDVL